LCGILIPTEHRVDRFGEFTKIPFIDTTCVDPEVLQLILGCLFGAKRDLLKGGFPFVGVFHHIFEEDLVVTPSV
jgi:hypothetical protein